MITYSKFKIDHSKLIYSWNKFTRIWIFKELGKIASYGICKIIDYSI